MNTEQQRAELLPCPFCGSTNIEIQTSTPDREGTPTHLMCADCGAAGPWSYERGGSYTVAAALWNTRAALQSQDEDIFSPTSLTGLSKDELIRRLQWALNYWMPNIADDGTPDGERAAREAYLLLGMQAPVGRKEENTPTYWERVSDLQSQDREDAERMDWLESVGSVDIVRTLDNKTEVYAPHNDLIYAAAGSMRAAIDHARHIEGDGE